MRSFYISAIMRKRASTAASTVNLPALRRNITDLVAKNAVPMVQKAIDSVIEEGQYQAIKYLFEMIGFYPAASQDESPGQDSLARTLLQRLGLPDIAPDGSGAEPKAKNTDPPPLE